MQKKGLATYMLILMALALIGLLIMFYLIGRSSGTYAKSTSCEATGGKCVKSSECVGTKSFLTGCKKEEVCCVAEGD